MPSLAVRTAMPAAPRAAIPAHAKAPKRSGEMPPDLYAALQLFFAIAQKEMHLVEIPTVEQFLLASCSVQMNPDMNMTLQSILGCRYSYVFLTNISVVIGALVIYNVYSYHLHGVPVDVEEAVQRILAGYRWYIRFAFSSAGLKAASLLPQLQDWMEKTAIPYIETQAPAQTMLGALEVMRVLVATKDYKKAAIRPIMLAIAATTMARSIQDA